MSGKIGEVDWDAEWLGRFRRWESSGQTAGTYIAAHGLSKSSFYYWLNKLRRKGVFVPKAPPVSFQPVTVITDEIRPMAPSEEKEVFTPLIARLRLPNGVDMEVSGLANMAGVGCLLQQAAALRP